MCTTTENRQCERLDCLFILVSATCGGGVPRPSEPPTGAGGLSVGEAEWALRAAGGEVTRFGMPVDPGNLLFIGRLQGAEVIGLPGCARSMALNGADWVLSRLACGLAVTSADIAGMGVGGLLKEVPSRPMPRTRKPR